MNTNPHLVVGIPFCGRPVAPEWALSLATQNYPIAMNVTYVSIKGKEIGIARNEIVDDALSKGAKYIWFIDDDTAPPISAIRKLVYILEQKPTAMVCGGIYCSRSDPPEPIVFKEAGKGAFWKWKVGDVFECSGIGTGCMLINTEIFKYIEKPYFKTIDESCENADLYKVQQTDDLYFCDKVIAAGYKILAHGEVLPIHWNAMTGQYYILPMDSYPLSDIVSKLKESKATGS